MNLHQARALLDAVRDGYDAPMSVIHQALIATGDIDDEPAHWWSTNPNPEDSPA